MRAEARRTYVPGRRSYGNFNPKVERAIKEVKASASEAAADADTLADEELAQHYADAYAAKRPKPSKRRRADDGSGASSSKAARANDFKKKQRKSRPSS